MEINDEITQKFSALNEVMLSAEDKADILQTLRLEMNQKKPRRKFNRGALSGFAAAVAAVAIVAGGFDFEMHHHQSTLPSPATRVTTASNQTQSSSKGTTNNAIHNGSGIHKKSQNSSNYTNEIAVIKNKGYSATGKAPNASVKTAASETLSAWICILSASQDGHNQRVLFFLNGNYVGIDAEPSPEIASAKPAGTGSIAVTYPVYRNTDSLANPTGVPVTVTYHWNGSKLVANKPMPKQFS